jgi:hypothetical protein
LANFRYLAEPRAPILTSTELALGFAAPLISTPEGCGKRVGRSQARRQKKQKRKNVFFRKEAEVENWESHVGLSPRWQG